MNILLLGSTGYLGGNIAKKLSNEGHRVICVVRPTSDCSRLERIDKKIEFISSNVEQIELTLKREKIDWIVNGVCTYRPNETLYGDMLNSNVMFPLSVLNLAVKYGVPNYMTIGTGLPDDFNVYSFTKHSFSEFGCFLSQKEKINFIDLQLEMFYGGENEPKNRFLQSCKDLLKANKPLQLTEGHQLRDIVRVEDVLEIISVLINHQMMEGYNVLPVGSGEQHSIRDIITFMKDQFSSSSELQFGVIPSREHEPSTCADIDWIKKLNIRLKWSYWDGLRDYCLRFDK